MSVITDSNNRRRGAISALIATARVAAVALALLALPGQRAAAATILLEVDATDPDAVTFIATDGLALASSSGVGFRVLLKDMLVGPIPNSIDPLVNDLVAAQGGAATAFINSRGADLDLSGFGGNTQTFIEGARAFTGSATVALPATSLRGDSFIGDITVRDNFGRDTGLVIGQYSLTVATPVPVPPSLALMVGSIAVAGLMLRRRRSA